MLVHNIDAARLVWLHLECDMVFYNEQQPNGESFALYNRVYYMSISNTTGSLTHNNGFSYMPYGTTSQQWKLCSAACPVCVHSNARRCSLKCRAAYLATAPTRTCGSSKPWVASYRSKRCELWTFVVNGVPYAVAVGRVSNIQSFARMHRYKKCFTLKLDAIRNAPVKTRVGSLKLGQELLHGRIHTMYLRWQAWSEAQCRPGKEDMCFLKIHGVAFSRLRGWFGKAISVLRFEDFKVTRLVVLKRQWARGIRWIKEQVW